MQCLLNLWQSIHSPFLLIREMQNKIKWRYYLSCLKLAKLQKFDNKLYWEACWVNSIYWTGTQYGTRLGKGIWHCLPKFHTYKLWFPSYIFRNLSQRYTAQNGRGRCCRLFIPTLFGVTLKKPGSTHRDRVEKSTVNAQSGALCSLRAVRNISKY